MSESFESLIMQENQERVERQVWERRISQNTGEDIYTDFCIYCNSKGNPLLRNSANAFGFYLKNECITLTEMQRRYIAEKYFGYKFNFIFEKKKWEISKNENI